MRKIFGLMLVTLLGGCGDDKGTSDATGTDGSGGSSGSATTSGSPTTGSSVSATATATATDGGTMGGSATMGDSTSGAVTDGGTTVEPGTTGDPMTTGGPGSGTTGGSTGGGGVDIPADCQAVCDAAMGCMLPVPPDCAMGCVADLGGSMGECATAVDAYLMCLAGMSCMELVDFFANDNPGPCTDEAGQTGLVCNMMPGDCTEGVGGNPNSCNYTKTCPNMPALEMQCNKNTCTCLVDGMEMGTCMSDAICMTQDQLPMKAADCCGF